MSVTVLKMHHGVVPKKKQVLKCINLKTSLIVLNVSAKYRSKKNLKKLPKRVKSGQKVAWLSSLTLCESHEIFRHNDFFREQRKIQILDFLAKIFREKNFEKNFEKIRKYWIKME